jgi:hypothetical protein
MTNISEKYAVYDLMTYFDVHPSDITSCPVCGRSLSQLRINPSRAVANDLLHESLIPVHIFSRLYKCSTCQWWATWEHWAFCECNSTCDFLIARAMGNTGWGSLPADDKEPWSRILEDEHVYNNADPLPDNLGRLFLGGVRKNIYSNNK